MIIYKDIVNGDEIITDSEPIKEIDGVIYEVECKMVRPDNVDNINIGANPSAEEAEEQLDSSGPKLVNNVVYGNRLSYLGDEDSKTPLFTSQKDYFSQLKKYLGTIKTKLNENGATEAEIKDFQTRAQNYYLNHIKPNFSNYEFYAGDSMNMDAMVVLLRWDEAQQFVTVWKHGLKAEKV